MTEEPDLRFDIDALFEHLTGNLDHDASDEQDWTFWLRSSNVEALKQVAGEFEDDFIGAVGRIRR